MAKQDEKIQNASVNQPQVDPAAARAAAMSQARARSLARAQTVARAQAMKKAQADARLRALLDDEDESVAKAFDGEAAAVEQAAVTENPVEESPIADAALQSAYDAPPAAFAEPIAQTAEAIRTEENDPDEVDFAVRIRGLYKNYGKKQVLKGLDLDVYPGELFGFIGRNGVGKSTTIDCMIGAKRFDRGEITVGGYNIRTEALDAKFSYGYVASEPTCYEVMTGYDYLEFVASIYNLTETEFSGNYKYLCQRLQLDVAELAHHVSGYSHGMKQKLCLIASLLHNPNIWVLDEPTVGLDIMAQEELKKMMREYANHGKTVFITSHNIEMVSAICDRVAIINDGVVKGVYDLNRDPQKRNELARIFIETYGG